MTIEDVLEMSYPRRNVETIITGLQEPLNQHLIKLVGFDFPEETRRRFREEIEAWLDRMQRMRLKPRHRPGSFKFYYDLLFDHPFGGVEVQNMASLMQFISRRYPAIPVIKTPEEMVDWLCVFHVRLAERLSRGEPTLDMIPI